MSSTSCGSSIRSWTPPERGTEPVIAYPALLVCHLLAVVLFVAGLLVAAALLPALTLAPRRDATWHLEVRRLRLLGRCATTPALLLVWAFGIAMAVDGGWYASGWLKAKVVLVVALSAWHGRQMRTLHLLATGHDAPRARAAALLGLVATIVAIVVLVVGKPF